MTKEEYKKEIKALEDAIDALDEVKIETRSKFLKDNAKFKKGDKVVVIWNEYKHPFKKEKVAERRIEAFIGGINDPYFSGEIDYSFRQCKKDGTEGSKSAGIYGPYDRIELLEPAKQ